MKPSDVNGLIEALREIKLSIDNLRTSYVNSIKIIERRTVHNCNEHECLDCFDNGTDRNFEPCVSCIHNEEHITDYDESFTCKFYHRVVE